MALRNGVVHLFVCMSARLFLCHLGRAPGRQLVSFDPRDLHPREISACGGGLLVAPINAPHVFSMSVRK